MKRRMSISYVEQSCVPAGASLAAARPMKVFVVESRRDYCGNVLYADGEIERVRTECGWYSPGGRYTAVVSDHQGNLRATLTKTYAASATSGSGARAPSGAGSQAAGAASASVGDVVGTGAAGAAGIGIGGGTVGGGIVIPVDPDANLRYTNLTAYSPYGLPLTDWQGEERYLYSGKELERGKGLMLYDFHARQYDPQLGRFTSPDPLRDDYPGLAPYLYCAANPISFTDPTGMKIKVTGMDHDREYEMFIVEGKSFEVDVYKKQDEVVEDKFVNQVIGAMNKIGKSSFGENMITQLIDSEHTINIKMAKFNPQKKGKSGFIADDIRSACSNLPEITDIQAINAGDGCGGNLYWNSSNNGYSITERGARPIPAHIALGHEFGHALDATNGILFPSSNYTLIGGNYNPLFKGEKKS